MRKPRLTLYGQILFWFFLNLALVMGVVFIGLRVQFDVGVWALISGQVNERIEAKGKLMAAELRESSLDDWDAIVDRHAEAYGVTLSVMTPDGSGLLAGADRGLPEVLIDHLRDKFPRRSGMPGDLRGGGGTSSSRDGSDAGEGLRPLPPRREWPGEEAFGSPPPRRSGPLEEERRVRPVRPRAMEGRPGGPGRPGYPDLVFHGRDPGTGYYWLAIAVSFPANEFRHPPDSLIVASAESLGGNDLFFDWRPWVWVLMTMVLVSALIWFPFVRRVSRRLGTLTAAAESISEGDFDVEVASERTDELGRLSRAVQRMAARLDDYVSGQKRFLGDIAHELCSPLVRARMSLGILEQELSGEDHNKLKTVNEEVEELSQLVNELLDFSKASLKPEALTHAMVDISELVDDVVRREAADAGVVVKVEGGLRMESNADLLKRALGNVLRNAVRYTETGGEIVVRARRERDELLIVVLDRGPGVPNDWLALVFEPFSRPERARTRESGGAGLGLAIAKTCTEALGGTVRGRNRTGGGFAVEFRFSLNR